MAAGRGGASSLFVVGVDEPAGDGDDADDDAGDDLSPGRRSLRALGRAPLIAGTPKMLRALYAAAADVAADPYPRHSGRTDAERAAAAALRSNLRAVVLDEADRLLRTEAVAREAAALAARRVAERRDGPAPRRGKGPRPAVARPTQTEAAVTR